MCLSIISVLCTYYVLNLKSVGHIEVIDLTSETIREILEQLDPQMHSKIMVASTIRVCSLLEFHR